MTIYDDLQATAFDILEEFDQGGIKLISLTAGSGDPDDPGEPTEVTTLLKGVAKGASFRYMREGFAVSGDLEVTVAVQAGVTPSIDDFIEVKGVRYKIIRDISVPAAGTTCAWKFIVRRGG